MFERSLIARAVLAVASAVPVGTRARSPVGHAHAPFVERPPRIR